MGLPSTSYSSPIGIRLRPAGGSFHELWNRFELPFRLLCACCAPRLWASIVPRGQESRHGVHESRTFRCDVRSSRDDVRAAVGYGERICIAGGRQIRVATQVKRIAKIDAARLPRGVSSWRFQNASHCLPRWRVRRPAASSAPFRRPAVFDSIDWAPLWRSLPTPDLRDSERSAIEWIATGGDGGSILLSTRDGCAPSASAPPFWTGRGPQKRSGVAGAVPDVAGRPG
jgi:hypothetical protein